MRKKIVKIEAPAKLNLGLRILGRRPDGYHEIRSLMIRISLRDEVSLREAGSGIRVTSGHPEIPGGEGNLAFRAARLFAEEFGPVPGLEIKIRKDIPVAAGLGGGSSDAAAVLEGLRRMFAPRLPVRKLREVSARIGADVPFFLFPGAARVAGIGERLSAYRGGLPPAFLLVNPGVKVSSQWAYSEWDRDFWDRSEGKGTGAELTDNDAGNMIKMDGRLRPPGARGWAGQGINWDEILRNDLEPEVQKAFPSVREVRGRLLAAGALGAGMSGSGPTFFGVFASPAKAFQAARDLKKEPGWSVWAVKPID
ncbi:MAG: 4-(cytidine 5'-diphospho)-2-C-methyl-D-erythritol kinase [Proteobacteria bacterium]|nr:4-(cytidine 5'-diphospho)-2-C-methyl-D-erythritol kinase [Pseudomonadota bacterium]